MSGQPALPEIPGVTHRFIEVNGLRVHLAEAGQGEPLVLLHGWPQHWWMWRRVIPGLAKHYRVICPDLRGFGWSEAPALGYDKENLASDLLALLDALQLPRVRLMAHDWGGWVGFLACIRAPERFHRYVALNIPHPFQHRNPRRLKDLARFWYQAYIALPFIGTRSVGSRGGIAETILRRAYVKRKLTDEEVETFAAVLRVPERARASTALYRTFLLRELPALQRGRYRKARLETPALLLFGRRDAAIPVSMLGGHEDNAADLRVELVDDAGHFVAEESPEIVARRALEFFGAA
ncbi:MAG TPA: alpha/beta hydrolase [Candidatus Binatia bacterium]|nr:alpha/beta hydrolase [Candidatus Binatia bacterium]